MSSREKGHNEQSQLDIDREFLELIRSKLDREQLKRAELPILTERTTPVLLEKLGKYTQSEANRLEVTYERHVRFVAVAVGVLLTSFLVSLFFFTENSAAAAVTIATVIFGLISVFHSTKFIQAQKRTTQEITDALEDLKDPDKVIIIADKLIKTGTITLERQG